MYELSKQDSSALASFDSNEIEMIRRAHYQFLALHPHLKQVETEISAVLPGSSCRGMLRFTSHPRIVIRTTR